MASPNQKQRRGKGREIVRLNVSRYGLKGLHVVPEWNEDKEGKILNGLEVHAKGRADINLERDPEVYRRAR